MSKTSSKPSSSSTEETAAASTPLTSESKTKALSETSIDDRITPPEFQRHPAAAGAVAPEHLNRNVDTVAARGEVPELRTEGNEPGTDAEKAKIEKEQSAA